MRCFSTSADEEKETRRRRGKDTCLNENLRPNGSAGHFDKPAGSAIVEAQMKTRKRRIKNCNCNCKLDCKSLKRRSLQTAESDANGRTRLRASHSTLSVLDVKRRRRLNLDSEYESSSTPINHTILFLWKAERRPKPYTDLSRFCRNRSDCFP